MNQFRIVSVFILCAHFAFSSTALAMSGKKVSGGSRDVASERDVASVEHESKGVPQLITYDELKSLSPERRAEYIEGVRSLIVELAAKGGKNFPMFAGGNTPEESYSLLEALVPAAYAQYENTNSRPQDIKPRYLRRQHLDNMELWTCDSDQAEFNYSVGTCVKKGGKLQTNALTCPSGYRDAHMKTGAIANALGNPYNKFCVPVASWKMLSPKRRSELSSPTGAESVGSYFRTKIVGNEQEIGAQVALGGTAKKKLVPPHLATPAKDALRNGDYGCPSSNPNVQYNEAIGTCTGREISRTQACPAADWQRVILVKEGWTERQRKYFCVTPASWSQLSEKRQLDLKEPVGVNAATSADREQAATGSGRKTYSAVTVTLPPARPADTVDAPSDKPETPVVERSPSEEIAQGGAPCTGISKMTCGDKAQKSEKRKAALDWWKNNENTCIFAGNVSTFVSKDYKEKTCQSVTSFSKPRLSCKEGVICNPIIFGAQADDSAICSTSYETATSDCDSKAGEKGKNAWLEKNLSSVKTEWNKLREGMMQSCGRNAVREYFCEECNVMMERLNSLSLLALNRDGEGVCHAPIMSYESKTARPAEAQQPAKAKQ